MRSMLLEKQRLRETLKKRFTEIGASSSPRWDEQICSHILKLSLYRQSKTIACFIPLPDEPDIWSVIRDAWKCGKTVVVPRIQGSELSFKKITSGDDLDIGRYGIREPNSSTPSLPLRFIDTCFIPGQAFDIKGNRLGRGKGYYDKILRGVKNPTIGICYGFRLIDSLPHESYDITVIGIITENGHQTCLV
jgi:5-formyltetrahydrofolate cyclo-ligase